MKIGLLAKPNRRQLGLLGAMVAIAAAVFATAQVLAVETPTLQERLEKGLKARTNADFTYIDRVVDSVMDGRLPQLLVDRVFFWARERADQQQGSKRKRPMIYFRPALTILAARLGVELD